MNYLTKQYIKEELYIQAAKLSCPNSYKLNDFEYINKVLGINVKLNESVSFKTQKLIIEEHIVLENFLDSIKKFVGNQVDTVVTAVKTFKDFAILIKDLIENPHILSSAIDAVKQKAVVTFNEIFKVIKDITTKVQSSFPEVVNKITNFLNKVKKTIDDISASENWKSFLQLVGFACILKWIELTIIDKISEKVYDFFKDDVFTTFQDIFNSFSTLVKNIISELDFSTIIKWFSNFNVGFNTIKSTVNMLTILGIVLAPIVSRVAMIKKLKKSENMNDYYLSQTKKLINEIKSESYMVKAIQKAANTNDQLFEYYMKIITEPNVRKDNENLFGEKVITMASKIFEAEEVKTVDSIAQKFNVDKSEIEKQVELGIKVEKEHTDSDDMAKKIALDHLNEIPDYYSRLTKMEKEAKKITKKTTKKKSKDEQV